MSTSKQINSNLESGEIPGLIVSPNPVEIFWEKNKKYILSFSIFLCLYIIGYYGVKYYNRAVRNKVWAKISLKFKLHPIYLPPNKPSLSTMGFSYRLGLRDRPLVSIPEVLSKFTGVSREWSLFFSSLDFLIKGEPEKVTQAFQYIGQNKLPVFFQSKFFSWPLLKNIHNFSDGKGREEIFQFSLSNFQPKENLQKLASNNYVFRKKFRFIYSAPKPKKSPSILFDTSIGSFRVKVFTKRLPLFSQNFIKKIRSGFYNGLRFHEIQRTPPIDPRFGFSLPSAGDIAWLGNPTTKSEDKSKWDLNYKSPKTIPFNDNGISHYKFVLAAKREKGELGCSDQVVYFTASDCSKVLDGDDVVFGVVIDGGSVISKITKGEFLNPNDAKLGRGIPKKPVKVNKVTIEE